MTRDDYADELWGRVRRDARRLSPVETAVLIASWRVLLSEPKLPERVRDLFGALVRAVEIDELMPLPDEPTDDDGV